MANEFRVKNGLIVSGSSTLLGTLSVTSISASVGISGSITTATTSSNAVTASYALSASWAPAGGVPATASYATTASAATSITFTPSSASYALSASWAPGGSSVSASYATTSSFSRDIHPIIEHGLTISGSLVTTGSSNFIGIQTVTGSLATSGSNELWGNTILSGTVDIVGIYPLLAGSQSIHLVGNTLMDGYLKFNPVVSNINQSISASYVHVSGSDNNLYFTEENDGFETSIKMKWLAGNLYTGATWGGVITSASSNTFQISSGSGLIVNLNATFNDRPHPVTKYITWDTMVGNIGPMTASYDQCYIAIDNDGVIVTQGTPFTNGQYDTLIPLGVVLHNNHSTINGFKTINNSAYGWKQRSSTFIRAFGPLKLSGFVMTPTGSSQFTINGGTVFADGHNYAINPNDPSYITDSGMTIPKYWRYRQSGSAWVYDSNLGAGYPTTDPGNYSLNGTVTPVGSNKWTIQRVFWFPTGITKSCIIYYGNAEYATKAEAIANMYIEPFIEAYNTATSAIYVGALILRNDGDFTVPASYAIMPGGLFRNVAAGGGGTPVAAALAGLSDVTLTNLSQGQPLVYNYAASQWVNSSSINAQATSAISASAANSASYAGYAVSASAATSITFVPTSASYATTSSAATSITFTPSSASYSVTSSAASSLTFIPLNATSASYAATASFITGSIDFPDGLIVTGSITASLGFSGSGASISGVVSSSYALSASYALQAVSASAATSITFTPTSASYALSASAATSITFTPSSASYALSASWAPDIEPATSSYATTSSWTALALTASAATSITFVPSSASYALTSSHAASSSWAPNAFSSSYAVTASYALGGATPSNVLYVDGKRTDDYSSDGSILTPYKTITSAISGAMSGVVTGIPATDNRYVIDIAPSIYTEDIIMTEFVSLTGRDIEGTIIDGSVEWNQYHFDTNGTEIALLTVSTVNRPALDFGAHTDAYCGVRSCYITTTWDTDDNQDYIKDTIEVHSGNIEIYGQSYLEIVSTYTSESAQTLTLFHIENNNDLVNRLYCISSENTHVIRTNHLNEDVHLVYDNQGEVPSQFIINDGYCTIDLTETMTLNVAPGGAWVAGDLIGGTTSGAICVVVEQVDALNYIVKHRTGAFTLGEEIGTLTNKATQTGSYPVFSGPHTNYISAFGIRNGWGEIQGDNVGFDVMLTPNNSCKFLMGASTDAVSASLVGVSYCNFVCENLTSGSGFFGASTGVNDELRINYSKISTEDAFAPQRYTLSGSAGVSEVIGSNDNNLYVGGNVNTSGLIVGLTSVGRGNISTISGSASVTGSNDSRFLSDFKAGSLIASGSDIHVVTSVVSDNHMTTTPWAFTHNNIGYSELPGAAFEVYPNGLARLTGSLDVKGNITATSGFSGSGALVTGVVSSSYATSASYALQVTSASAATSITFVPSTASFATTASAATSITFVPATASYATNAATASYISGAIDFLNGLIVTGSVTASLGFSGSIQSASFASSSYTTVSASAATSITFTPSSASYATTASYATDVLGDVVIINTGSFGWSSAANMNTFMPSAVSVRAIGGVGIIRAEVAPTVQLLTISGTIASPMALLSSSLMGSVLFQSLNQNGARVTSAGIGGVASQAQSSSAHGGQLEFRTTPLNSSATAFTRMILDENGDLYLGGVNPNATTYAKMVVFGSVSSSLGFSGSIQSASYAGYALSTLSASYAPGSPTISGSYAETASYAALAGAVLGNITSASAANSASFAGMAETASYALVSQTTLGAITSASAANSASWASLAYSLISGTIYANDVTSSNSLLVLGAFIDNTKTQDGAIGYRATNLSAGSNAYAFYKTVSDTANAFLYSHATGRVAARYGITLGGYNELLGSSGNGLLLGTGTTTGSIIFGINNIEIGKLVNGGILAITGSVSSSVGFSGSIQSASFASSSYTTVSASAATSITFTPTSASYALVASSANTATSSSYATSASYGYSASSALVASSAASATSASYAISASYGYSSSFAFGSTSSSFAYTASYALVAPGGASGVTGSFHIISQSVAGSTVNGMTITKVAGEPLTFGELVYFNSDGAVWTSHYSSSASAPAMAMCGTANLPSGSPGLFLLMGVATSASWTWTVGTKLYMAASGSMTQSAVGLTDYVVQHVGIAHPNPTTVYFNPSTDFIQRT